jgi:hypothetical protein
MRHNILIECISIIPSFLPEGKYCVKYCADIWARIRLLVRGRKGMRNGENLEKHDDRCFNSLQIFKPKSFTSMELV